MCIRDRNVTVYLSICAKISAVGAGFVHEWSSTAIKATAVTVSYTHLRAHETVLDLVCRLLLEKKKKTSQVPRVTSLQASTSVTRQQESGIEIIQK